MKLFPFPSDFKEVMGTKVPAQIKVILAMITVCVAVIALIISFFGILINVFNGFWSALFIAVCWFLGSIVFAIFGVYWVKKHQEDAEWKIM